MAAVARRAQFPALLQTCNGYTDRTAITYQKVPANLRRSRVVWRRRACLSRVATVA